jgi:hypothetical protein
MAPCTRILWGAHGVLVAVMRRVIMSNYARSNGRADTVPAPLVSTRIQLPAVPAVPAPLPEGWDAELMAAVETGRVSYRRALRIVGAR